jgi:hypothetical protein
MMFDKRFYRNHQYPIATVDRSAQRYPSWTLGATNDDYNWCCACYATTPRRLKRAKIATTTTYMEVGNAQPAILSSNPLRTRYSLKEPKCTYYYYILTSIVVILYILLFSIKIKNTQIAGVAGVAGSYQVHRKTVFTDSTYL